jgi:hypothetical protein
MENYSLILSELFRKRSFYVPLLILISLGLAYLLPQNIIIFMIIGAVLIFTTYDNPKAVLYISAGLITFRYFFVDSSGMEFTGLPPSSIFFRFRLLTDYFVSNLHNFVFIYLFLAFLKNNAKIKRDSMIIKPMITIIGVIILIMVLSALLNETSLMLVVLFVVQLIRPVLFLLLILCVDWTEEDLLKFFIYILTLIFSLQLILTTIDNIRYILQGYILLSDNLTGSFTFPFNWVATQLLVYSSCMFFSMYLYTKNKKAAIAILICAFFILSAQTGFQTFYNLLFLIPFFFYVNVNSIRLDLGIIKSTFYIVMVVIFLFIGYFVLREFKDLPGYDLIYTYNELGAESIKESGLAEYPKFKIYEIFFNFVSKGEINLITGVGPGNFLSGAGIGSHNKFYELLFLNPFFFKVGITNTGAFIGNSFLGILGEIGILGMILVYSLYIIPFRFVVRNITEYIGTPFMPVAVGAIGVFLSVVGFSFVWNAFEDFAIPVYYFIIVGIVIAYKERVLDENIE